MTRLTIILSLVILSSCDFDADRVLYIHPDIQPYYDSFIIDAKDRGLNLEGANLLISLKELEGNMNGVYKKSGSNVHKIYIDESSFYKDFENKKGAYESRRKVVIYHELSHALMRLGHANDSTSIMSTKTDNPYMIFKENEVEMIDGLFE